MARRGRALGIIGCHLLEDEMVHVLGKDRDMRRIVLIDNNVSDTILGKLEGLTPKREILLLSEKALADQDLGGDGTVIVWQKPIELHVLPWELRDSVLSSLRNIERHCGAVLLFYGLCGNAFRNFESLVAEFDVPVTIMTDHSGQVVDDCIGTAIGGVDEYLHLLRTNSGTFYLTPMWSSNWKRFFVDIRVIQDINDLDGARYVFQFMGYKRVLKIETGLGDVELFEKDAAEFARTFDLDLTDVPAGVKVAERSYEAAKELLTNGRMKIPPI
ncbi:MAG TPA: DUF1638 domain-containing protein [Methanomassiliicoccales archaeon]|nr:DUF1638 domain-containing protein [Methanomassiliicoccales archaeon]